MSITPIQKIFAFNTGSTVFGTSQVGDIAISNIEVEYSANYGGLQWWGGPDETFGYVIAYPIPELAPVTSTCFETVTVLFIAV